MKDLNKGQLQGVTAGEGPILIIAGPGTGKTKTLTARISHLLKKGVAAEKILALTFTNKAAREMSERTRVLLPRDTNLPLVTTFHSYCYQLIRDVTGEEPAIISEIERQQILRDIKKSQSLKGLSVRELSLRLSLAKSLSETQTTDSGIATLLQNYQKSLEERNVCDYDDLLIRAYHLLKEPVNRPAFDHILVDEFQDTNDMQYQILKLLNPGSIFAIGDPLQSIYGFRGANAGVFDTFLKDWPQALTIHLERNYRSTPDIVALSGSVFSEAPLLSAQRPDTGQVKCVQVLNEYSEANWIIRSIEQSIGGSTMIKGHDHHMDSAKSTSFRNFAVLYRTHRTAQILKRLLDESGLPYQIAGEGSPYQQPAAAQIIDALHGKDSPRRHVSELVAQTAKNLGIDAQTPAVQTLTNTAVRFDGQNLEAFLAHIDAIAEQEFYDPTADAITLLTIHAAKGLEFKHVFLIGAEEGILPHHPPKAEPNLGEEKRLFYVAITRARDNLDILYAKKRAGKYAAPSQFITDIPANILPHITDPNMPDEQKRLKKIALKRSQTSLF